MNYETQQKRTNFSHNEVTSQGWFTPMYTFISVNNTVLIYHSMKLFKLKYQESGNETVMEIVIHTNEQNEITA